MEKLKGKDYFSFGIGNVASQLSWTMVSSYLTLFYTDVFGLQAGVVAVLFLVARIWDGINDPMMGEIMEHTHTKIWKISPLYCNRGSAVGCIYYFDIYCTEFWERGKFNLCLHYIYWTWNGLYNDECTISCIASSYV